MNQDSNQIKAPISSKKGDFKTKLFKHKKLLTIAVTSIVSLGFIGSIVYSVFSGGELLNKKEDAEKSKRVNSFRIT